MICQISQVLDFADCIHMQSLINVFLCPLYFLVIKSRYLIEFRFHFWAKILHWWYSRDFLWKTHNIRLSYTVMLAVSDDYCLDPLFHLGLQNHILILLFLFYLIGGILALIKYLVNQTHRISVPLRNQLFLILLLYLLSQLSVVSPVPLKESFLSSTVISLIYTYLLYSSPLTLLFL